MKTIYYPLLLLLILCSGLSACKKNNKEPENEEEKKEKTQEELIVGKWKLVQGYDLNGEDVADDCDKKNILEFFADKKMHWFQYQHHAGNCAEYFYHLRNNVTYKIEGKNLSFHWVVKPEEGTGGGDLTDMTFEVNETRLIIRVTPTHKGTIYQRIN